MLIVVSRDSSGFYEALKPRQEAKGTDRVILDRRISERRRSAQASYEPDRRQIERRAPVVPAEQALMRVLGFMVLHPEARVATVMTGPASMKVICAWCQEEGRPGIVREKEPLETRTRRTASASSTSGGS